METKLLRKPWIAHALCSLLDRNRQPSVACAIVQLIQVEGAGAAIVSDRFHFIKVQFTAACIESFGRRRVRLGATTTTPCARSLHAINGGFLHLRTWPLRAFAAPPCSRAVSSPATQASKFSTGFKSRPPVSGGMAPKKSSRSSSPAPPKKDKVRASRKPRTHAPLCHTVSLGS